MKHILFILLLLRCKGKITLWHRSNLRRRTQRYRVSNRVLSGRSINRCWYWDTSNDNAHGAPKGGFVAYLNVSVRLKNQQTGAVMKIPRLPHRNLIDNLHHARNITLPGSVDALYTTTFTISPPQGKNLRTHHDWHQKVGYLNEESTFTYQDLLFDEVSKKIRKKT